MTSTALVTAAEPAEPGEATTAGWAYRPHLDGLRAVAVYLVVAFHAGVGRLANGFIGVDVFFVLSGFLVTGILIREHDTDGTVSLGRFYARRVRRLLPAAALVLVVTAVVFSSLIDPTSLSDLDDSIRAAALYVSNWWFIDQATDYFGAEVASNPVLHFWSLSVEEQFYVLWPLLFLGAQRVARRAGRRARHVVRGLVALAALASLVAALVLAASDPLRAYYGTDTRAYQLLAGALLALTPGLARRVGAVEALRPVCGVVSLAAVVGLVGLSTTALDVGPVSRGTLACATTVVLLLALEATAGPGRAILGLGPLVYLGRISYGTYLWHWMVILAIEHVVHISAPSRAIIAAAVATGLAALSHQLLELPIRTWRPLDGHRWAVVGTGLLASVLVAVVVAPAVVDRGEGTFRAAPPQVQAMVRTRTPVPAVDWEAAAADHARLRTCDVDDLDRCVVQDGGSGRMLLIGDSHAAMYLPLWRAVAAAHDLELATAQVGRCPWVRGIHQEGEGGVCAPAQDAWFDEVIPAYDPDVVVLAHAPIDDPNRRVPIVDRDAGALAPQSADGAAIIERRVRATLEALAADGREVIAIEPLPVAPAELEPVGCVARAEVLEECAFVTPLHPGPEEAAIAAVDSEQDLVRALDVDAMVCPDLPVCAPVVDGRLVRWDRTHLTREFVATLVPPVQLALAVGGGLGTPAG